MTADLYYTLMGGTTNNPMFPIKLSVSGCNTFVGKLNILTGLFFRLPTRDEWQYAAKGGNKSKGYIYSGSNTISDVAWYSGNSNNATHKVAQLMPNELGFYDMSGNVWEWTSTTTYSGSNYYCGGCYSSSESYCKVTYSDSNGSNNSCGLRLALSIN